MENIRYSPEEISVIKNLFTEFDEEETGKIHFNQLAGFLTKLGKSEDDILKVTEEASRMADENEGEVGFDQLIFLLQKLDKQPDASLEGTDPKVMEFLRILEEYRVKCEDEGNYLEAGRAYKQLGVLRKQEEKRQQKVILARHVAEKQDVQLAHNMQFSEFNKAWDKYMEEYDNMAQMYIQQMTERHAIVLLEFQKQLRQELAAKPPKWSRELLDQRRKQHINARNKNYTTAQKLKKLSDRSEERERKEMEQSQALIFARREAKFRMQQQTELQALLKRIECRRKEHIKQRNIDTKRLLQRNRNVQAVLESKHAAESQRLFNEIKKVIYSSANLNNNNKSTAMNTQSLYSTIPKKSSNKSKMMSHPGNNGSIESTAMKDPSWNPSQQGVGGPSSPSNYYDEQFYLHNQDIEQQLQDLKLDSDGHGMKGEEVDDVLHQTGDSDHPKYSYHPDENGTNPSFLKDSGPNFNSLVYAGEEGYGGGGTGVADGKYDNEDEEGDDI